MKLKILSFGGEAFSSESVSSVTLMTAIGEITLLDDHAPLLTELKQSCASKLATKINSKDNIHLL